MDTRTPRQLLEDALQTAATAHASGAELRALGPLASVTPETALAWLDGLNTLGEDDDYIATARWDARRLLWEEDHEAVL